jgi:nucleotide-binding universal stress UspA family protein
VAGLLLVTRWRRAQALRIGGVPATTAALQDAARHASGDGSLPFPSGGIVVGFDNSAPARRALSQAARLATAKHEALHVVYADHVIIDSDLSGFAHAEMEEARDQEAATMAEAVAGIVAEVGVVPYTFERSLSTAGDAILSAAKALAASDGSSPLIVVGRSGHAAHHLLGSVPTHLLARSPFPVLAIP